MLVNTIRARLTVQIAPSMMYSTVYLPAFLTPNEGKTPQQKQRAHQADVPELGAGL